MVHLTVSRFACPLEMVCYPLCTPAWKQLSSAAELPPMTMTPGSGRILDASFRGLRSVMLPATSAS